jgi:uncharacterized small protein (DUF1192 family)
MESNHLMTITDLRSRIKILQIEVDRLNKINENLKFGTAQIAVNTQNKPTISSS